MKMQATVTALSEAVPIDAPCAFVHALRHFNTIAITKVEPTSFCELAIIHLTICSSQLIKVKLYEQQHDLQTPGVAEPMLFVKATEHCRPVRHSNQCQTQQSVSDTLALSDTAVNVAVLPLELKR